MAIALRAAAAWAAGTTAPAPVLPAGLAAGDIMRLFIGCKPFDATIDTPTGWTRLTAGSGNNGSVAMGVDTGSVLWATFWREWQSGDAAPTINITTGNVSLAQITAWSKGSNEVWETPVSGKGSDTTSGVALLITSAVDVGISVGDFISHGAVIAGNNSTFGTQTLTAVGALFGTVTESPATEGTTAGGNDLEATASEAECTTGPSSAAPIAGWTLSVAQTGGGSITRLRVRVPAPPIVVMAPMVPMRSSV